MNDYSPTPRKRKRRSLLHWLTLLAVVLNIPLAWIAASESTLQVRADDCSLRQMWGHDPQSGFPALNAEEVIACERLRSQAGIYFVLAVMAVLINMVVFEGVAMRREWAVKVFGGGLIYLVVVAQIMQAGIPWYSVLYNLAVLGCLIRLRRRGEFD